MSLLLLGAGVIPFDLARYIPNNTPAARIAEYIIGIRGLFFID
jgi:hypothetical protein